MKTVNICGVPEHFNLPWHFAIEEGAFAERGIDLLWRDIPEGTGKMAKLLAEGKTDLAIILTEGIVKSISEGNPSKVIQTYIGTPLQWGIHVDGQSELSNINELQGKKAAISRFGSGSHLMAYVHAQTEGWNTNTLQFEVVNNLDGAVSALHSGLADYFMWEHFTTKPLVDEGTFKRLGDCPTPWPCFVIAGNQTFLERHQSLMEHILEVINNYTIEFKRIPSIDRTFANRYAQKLEDIQEWLNRTNWSQEKLPYNTLNEVITKLDSLHLMGSLRSPKDFLWNS